MVKTHKGGSLVSIRPFLCSSLSQKSSFVLSLASLLDKTAVPRQPRCGKTKGPKRACMLGSTDQKASKSLLPPMKKCMNNMTHEIANPHTTLQDGTRTNLYCENRGARLLKSSRSQTWIHEGGRFSPCKVSTSDRLSVGICPARTLSQGIPREVAAIRAAAA
jgi:hypothetical protein